MDDFNLPPETLVTYSVTMADIKTENTYPVMEECMRVWGNLHKVCQEHHTVSSISMESLRILGCSNENRVEIPDFQCKKDDDIVITVSPFFDIYSEFLFWVVDVYVVDGKRRVTTPITEQGLCPLINAILKGYNKEHKHSDLSAIRLESLTGLIVEYRGIWDVLSNTSIIGERPYNVLSIDGKENPLYSTNYSMDGSIVVKFSPLHGRNHVIYVTYFQDEFIFRLKLSDYLVDGVSGEDIKVISKALIIGNNMHHLLCFSDKARYVAISN